jgi:hypothetical protein
MCVILQTWCQIQRTFSSLRYLKCGPWHIQCKYSSAYSGFNIQLRVSALILELCRQFNAPYTANIVPNTAHILQITLCDCGPGHIYNVFTAPHIQASIFKWTYLRCHCWYIDKAMCVILQTWCQIQRTTSSLRNVNCWPEHIQCIYSSAYSGFNFQLHGPELLLVIYRQFNVRYTANMVPNTAHMPQITLCELWSRPHTA